MTDRQPGAPGQYKAVITTYELQKMQSGQPFTITMTRDDKPITPGTPYNKASVLPDRLAQTICPDILDPTPANALEKLLEKASNAESKASNAESKASSAESKAASAANAANAAMPKSGGYFTGCVVASRQQREISYREGELVNVSIRVPGSGSAAYSKMLIFDRK